MQLIVVAAAVATLAVTLGISSLSKKIRHHIPLGTFITELVECPYCLSHWLAAPLAVFITNSIFDWFISWLAIVAIAQIFILPIGMVLNANYSSEESE